MKIELRSDSRIHIEGYVNAVERDSRIINVPSIGRCVEQIRAGAFENALRAAPDVLILENHDDSRRLGSVSEGNLSLYEDNIGLRAIADIDDENIAEKARNGKIRGWSFGFVCTDSEIEQRSGNVPRRIVKALSLSEVSLIDGGYTPCYNGTLVEVRSGGDLIEYRSGIDENVETDNKTDENGSGDAAGLSYYDAVIRSFEMRYNPYHDPGNGRFCSGSGSGGGTAKQYTISSGVMVENDFTANRDLIDSLDYTVKFDNISDNPLMMWKLAQTARNCIYDNDGTQNETTVVLTKFAGKTVSETHGKYDAGSGKVQCNVIVPEGSPNSLILIHNHGNSSPFSFEDFAMLNDCKEIDIMIAAGHNGTVFKMSVGKGKRLDLSNDNVYNDYENIFARAYNHKTGDLTALENVCQELGWRFEYE